MAHIPAIEHIALNTVRVIDAGDSISLLLILTSKPQIANPTLPTNADTTCMEVIARARHLRASSPCIVPHANFNGPVDAYFSGKQKAAIALATIFLNPSIFLVYISSCSRRGGSPFLPKAKPYSTIIFVANAFFFTHISPHLHGCASAIRHRDGRFYILALAGDNRGRRR